jgi:hypothetical protein
MPTYLIINRPLAGYVPSAKAAAEWNAWFAELDTHLVSRGNPTFTHAVVGDCGPDSVLGGYTLVRADDLAAATALAKNCPVLDHGGGVEVGELTEIN